MSKYAVSLNMTDVANRVFNGLDVPSSTITSFGAFRVIVQNMHKACLESKRKMEAERAEMLSVYSQSAVTDKLQELNASYNAKITAIKSRLIDKLSLIASAKEDAISNYTVVAPSDEQMRLLQTVQMRGNTISDTEWQMIVRKCADNYQALSVIQSIAEKTDRPFSMPFSPDKDLEKLQLLKSRCENAIASIDKDADTYDAMEFLDYGADSDNMTTQLINDLDTNISSSTPASLKDALREASRNALHVGDYDTFNTISKFIVDNSVALSATVPSIEIKEAAQILIDAGNNATEKKPTYVSHRDEILKNHSDQK